MSPPNAALNALVDQETLAPSALPLTEAVGLPAPLYAAPWAHELDMQAIFRQEWLFVCREQELPNAGDYVAMTVADEPIIVVRTSEGTINAFSAVCRHRAMVVADGAGHCDRLFRCPYHGWTYDVEGQLKGVPGMAGRDIDRSALSMPRFHVECWQSFVFVSFSENPQPLAPKLAPADELVEPYRLSDLVSVPVRDVQVDVNWKTMTENNLECYHCEHLHHDTHKCAPTRNVVIDGASDGDSPLTVLRVRTVHQDAFFSPDWKPHFPVIPSLGEEERNHFMWIGILPTFMVALYHDHGSYWGVYPTGPESIEIRMAKLYPEATVARPDFAETHERIQRETLPLWEEDCVAINGVQRGRRSHFVNRGPQAELDEGVVSLNRWLIKRYEQAGFDSSGTIHRV